MDSIFLKRAIYPKKFHDGTWITAEKDTEYAFWTEGYVAYLSFQGSTSVTDWIYNLIFIPIYRHYFVHRGIYKKYSYIKEEINEFIGNNLDKKIIFTGHSQGAGMALIAMVYSLRERDAINAGAVLFGCPKIFNLPSWFFLKKYNKKIVSFKIRTDIIPMVLPTNASLGTTIKLGPSKPIWKWKPSDHFPSTYDDYYEEIDSKSEELINSIMR